MSDWYKKSVHEVLTELTVNPDQGLSNEEAERRLQAFGPNEIDKKPGPSALKILIEQFISPLILLLIGATVVSAVLGKIADAGIILAIVVINATIGFRQSYKAERAIDALKKRAAPQSRVLRNGRITETASRYLVPGDVILLETGDIVPADARLTELTDLQTQEATLTGESTPIEKQTDALKGNLHSADQKNMLFASTIITRGHAKAAVVTTGMATEFGTIARLMQQEQNGATPMQKKFGEMARFMGIIAVAIIIVTFGLGLLRGGTIIDMLLVAIALAVAAVPEGLPAVITITLASGVQRMARRNALIRKLPSAETLGSVSVICTDKTGTLTHNEMTVRKLWVNGHEIEVTGSGYNKNGVFVLGQKPIAPLETHELKLLLTIGGLCTNTHVIEEDNQTKVIGDPTEGALMIAGEKAGLEAGKLSQMYPRIGEIEFTSERKMMTTLNKINRKKVALCKGAPEIILDHCDRILINGRKERLTRRVREKIIEENEKLAHEALRVLGFAYKETTASSQLKNIEQEMTFVGLQAMIDPPREEVKESIKKCEDANIKVVMITGDHKITAVAIAEDIGIKGKVITGEELEALSDDQLKERIEDIGIFARVNPTDKLRIIEAFKARNHIVAMTGDGINDAPALKKADLGIAMGLTGTDVTKEASGMILTDDNFSSIVNAVEEGRGIANNIRKFLASLLGANLGEVLIILIAMIIGLPLPLTAQMLLLVNLFTDGLPTLALSAEPIGPEVMKSKPRDPNEPIYKGLNIFFVGYPIVMTSVILGLFIFAYQRSQNEAYAQTVAFLAIVFSELYQNLSIRSLDVPLARENLFKNKWIFAATAVSATACLLIIYHPQLQVLFKTVALSGMEVVVIALLSSAGAVYIEIAKHMKYRRMLGRSIVD